MTQPRYAPRPEEPVIIIDAPNLGSGSGANARSNAGAGSSAGPNAGSNAASATESGSAHTPQHPVIGKALDGVLSVQRPIVLAHLKRIRARNPGASPAELIHLLERHFLTTVMAGGAGVGVAAAVPAVGTAAAIALASAETLGFIEATALFAHAVAEVHGIVLVDRDRTHALVLSLMLGEEGATLIRQVTAQAAGGLVRGKFWSEIVTTALPRSVVSPALDQLRSMFLKKLAKTGTASVIGKAIPYGVGAVIGGTGNRILGKRVVRAAHIAFGPAPLLYPQHLAEIPPKVPRKIARAEKKVQKQLQAEQKQPRTRQKLLRSQHKQLPQINP